MPASGRAGRGEERALGCKLCVDITYHDCGWPQEVVVSRLRRTVLVVERSEEQ